MIERKNVFHEDLRSHYIVDLKCTPKVLFSLASAHYLATSAKWEYIYIEIGSHSLEVKVFSMHVLVGCKCLQ